MEDPPVREAAPSTVIKHAAETGAVPAATEAVPETEPAPSMVTDMLLMCEIAAAKDGVPRPDTMAVDNEVLVSKTAAAAEEMPHSYMMPTSANSPAAGAAPSDTTGETLSLQAFCCASPCNAP